MGENALALEVTEFDRLRVGVPSILGHFPLGVVLAARSNRVKLELNLDTNGGGESGISSECLAGGRKPRTTHARDWKGVMSVLVIY